MTENHWQSSLNTRGNLPKKAGIMFQKTSFKTALFALTAFVFGFTVIQAQSQPAISGQEVPTIAAFDTYWLEFIERWKIPGASIAVMKEGRLVYARGFGYADLETKQIVQPDSKFRMASLSKTVTSALVLRLVQDGKLSLETRVMDVLKDVVPFGGKLGDPRWAQITVKMLLAHTAGFDMQKTPDPMFRVVDVAKKLNVASPASANDVLRYMLSLPLDFEPGSKYAYSNFGYSLLGRIIEKVTGQPYGAHAKGMLTQYGIKGMDLGRTLLKDRLPGEVRYYDLLANRMYKSIFAGSNETLPYLNGGSWSHETLDSAGGWVTSSADLLRFSRAVFGPTENRLLNDASVQVMSSKADLSADDASFYAALGLRSFPKYAPNALWHDGRLPGTRALLIHTKENIDAVALFNTRVPVEEDGKMFNQAFESLYAMTKNTIEWPSHDLFKD
jgi:CubicO group peptidase (beta-lactamase class C family)